MKNLCDLKAGDKAALISTTSHSRIRNVTIKRVMKTFIEVEDVGRFDPVTGKQTYEVNGQKPVSVLFRIHPDVAYFDHQDQLQSFFQEIRGAFQQLAAAAAEHNLKDVKAAYSNLMSLTE